MDRERLRQLLKELHQELRSADTLDAESRARLAEVLEDVGRIDAKAGPEAHASAAERLRAAILDFEAAHPRLSLAAGQVADALGKLGI